MDKSVSVSPRIFVHNIFWRCFLIGLLIPLLFSVVGRFDFVAFATRPVTQVIWALNYLWPPLVKQQILVAQELGESQATSYGIFCIVIFFYAMYIGLKVHKQRPRSHVVNADQDDVFLFLLIIFLTVLAALVDAPDIKGNPLLDFHPTTSGLFYFRQYLIFYIPMAAIAASAFAVSIWLGRHQPAN